MLRLFLRTRIRESYSPFEDVFGKSTHRANARGETKRRGVVVIVRRYRGTRDTSDDVLRDGFIRVVAVRGDDIGRVVQEAKFEVLFE